MHGLLKSRLAFLFIFVCLYAALAQAEPGAVEFTFASHTMTAHLPLGFHFNAQAPNRAEIDGAKRRPQRLEPREAIFDLPSEAFKSAQAWLFVCDDANTFCAPRSYAFGGDGKSAALKMNSVEPVQEEAHEGIDAHGFQHGGLAGAIDAAQKKNTLVLAQVSARWCPGCVRLESEAFPSPEFKRAAAGFVKARIDSDRSEAQGVRDLYKVRSIPTLLILNGEGREVSRLVDYQSPAVIAAFLREAKRNPEALETLRDRGAHDLKSARTAGMRLFAAERYAEAAPLLERLQPKPPELWRARAEAARAVAHDDAAREPEAVEALHLSIAAFPKSLMSIKLRTELCAMKSISPDEKSKLSKEGVALADDLLAHPSKIQGAARGDNLGEFTGFAPLYVADLRADLIEAASLGDEAVAQARRKVTEVGRSLKIPLARRGPSLRMAVAFAHAKQWPQAEQLLHNMLTLQPDDPELTRRLARALNMQNKRSQAAALAEKAQPMSYGVNAFWVALERAKAYAALDRTQEAATLLREFLGRPDAGEPSLKREHDEMEQLLASFAKEAKL